MGYTKKDVDSFFDIVVMSYTELYKSNAELTNQVKTLTDSLVHYRTTESKLQKSLMLAEKNAEEATKNARAAAEKFAKDSDSSLGKIRNASQGQFSISDRDANTPYIKSIRVVTTVNYYLKR